MPRTRTIAHAPFRAEASSAHRHNETKVRQADGDGLIEMCRTVLEGEVARLKGLVEKIESVAIAADVHAVESLFSGSRG